MTRWTLPLMLLCACATKDSDAPTDDTDTDATDTEVETDTEQETDVVDPEPACGDDEVVVQFATSDGETLEADWWPAAEADAPVVVLFHMSPEGPNSRVDYPVRVRTALHDAGYALLNVDRRGAGGSTGEADEATVGAGALADAEAAVGFVVDSDRDCAIDDERLVLVGASNGTTLILDYTIAHDSDLPHPASLVWMSAGDYSQAQYDIEAQVIADRPRLSFPMLWFYPTNEPFSEHYRVVLDVPGAWEFIQRGTAHGTNMFDDATLEADTMASLLEFLGRVLTPET